MSADIVLLFPGQGSQRPGMGKDLAAAFSAARDVFQAADEALGIPLSTLCFEGPEGELTATDVAQPALLAHGAAVWAVVRDSLGPRVRAAAGHSLGEFSAYCAAGALSLSDALRLVRRRGALMRESGLARPGAMAAVIGLDDAAVEELCRRASAEAGIVVPANYNTPGQLVVSGEEAAVDRAIVLAREAGARRAIRLNVSGAFHSPLMAMASTGLGEALAAVAWVDPAWPVYANVTAEAVTGAARARQLLLEQLTAPVRWTEEVLAMARDVPGALFLELGPGTVLGGLVRRIAPDAAVAPCGTVADVERLLERVAT